jgi:hypothetical protein
MADAFTQDATHAPHPIHVAKSYSLIFRVDYGDIKENNDPTLDLNILENGRDLGCALYKLVHHTDKEEIGNEYLYRFNVEGISINGVELENKYDFLLKLTRQYNLAFSGMIIKSASNL